jgi:UDP:flavonoid glycosyltransferase YjiC (YdhE family)
VAALGVGIALDEEQHEGARLASAATELLRDGNIRNRINAVRATVDALPGPDEVARHLADLA